MDLRRFIINFIFSWVLILSPIGFAIGSPQMHNSKTEMSCCSKNQEQDSKKSEKKSCEGNCKMNCNFSCSVFSFIPVNIMEKEENNNLIISSPEPNFPPSHLLAKNLVFTVWNPPKF